MKSNLFIKILASIPVILITLYFIPFLGICLVILRYFVSTNKKKKITPNIFLVFGILILIPKIIDSISKLIKVNIPYLNIITNSDLYNIELIKYSKFLITFGILVIIISFIFKSIFNKVNRNISGALKNYINETERKNLEISKKNDMEIKLKQEKAKNTNYVRCPHCGSDNILSEKTGKCSYCRRTIENKNYKGGN